MNDNRVELLKLLFRLIEDNVPIDCKDVILDLKSRILKDIRDLGFEKALEKWTNDETLEEIEVIFS